MPLVSVIIPSYNHEKFIEECIESVLTQTFQDFEIIITDDGSKDGTVEKIKRFTDPRIQFYQHRMNQGACVAANNCLKYSQGQFVAMLSSDDAWKPEKLQLQVDYLQAHPDIYAVFSRVQWVDENSQPILSPDFFYRGVFDAENRSRYEWLHFFFFGGNCLCHPSSLIRREVYDEVGGFNPCMANLPDFDLWHRLCLHYEIHIIESQLINFRHFEKETNASGANLSNNIRVSYEARKILDNYLSITQVDDFVKIFPECVEFGSFSAEDIPFILGRLAVSTGINYKVIWGLDTIYQQLQAPEKAERIYRKFGFKYTDLIRLTGASDVFSIRLVQQEYLNSTQKSPEPEENHPPTKPVSGLSALIIKIGQRINYKRDAELVSGSGFFDPEWYLTHYPDVASTKISPIRHYLLYGGLEGRDPGPNFSSQDYLSANPDVISANFNPLLHYLLHGKKEGRKICGSEVRSDSNKT